MRVFQAGITREQLAGIIDSFIQAILSERQKKI